jgi:phosphopantetheinyl transferase
MKESFIKAVGLGLQIPLNRFTFESALPVEGTVESAGIEDKRKAEEVFRVNHQENAHEYITLLTDFKDPEYKLAVCKEIK